MAQPPDPGLGRKLRELMRGLSDAPDAHVARAVALVDALPSRGEADQLLAPLRPRLARLRPPRPLRFARLLFLPLDPVIVAPPRWRPNLPAIPRSVLNALAATVRAGPEAPIAAVDALIRTATLPDAETVARAGALLWPHAAALLFRAPPPVGWAETGLGPALYPPLARRVSVVLAQALVLEEQVAEAAVGIVPPRAGPVRAMLADVCQRCPEACPMLVAVLLGRLPQCAGLLDSLAGELGPKIEPLLRQATVEATEALLSRMEAAGSAEQAVGAGELADSVQDVRRISLLLRRLGESSTAPQLQARLHAVRQRLSAGCRQAFAWAMAEQFLPALRQGGSAASLEATARRLRELETDARLLGDGEAYDAQLRQAAAAVAADDARSLVARARLMEIFVGPEAAAAFLDRA